MHSTLRHPPSNEELAILFKKGRVDATFSHPSFAKRVGSDIFLQPHFLRQPSTFLWALRDFVDACVLPRGGNGAVPETTESDWENHLTACEAVIRKEKTRFGKTLTTSGVRSRISGQQAEFAVSTWIRSMLRCFNIDPSIDVSIPEWSKHEASIHLGCGYVMHPQPPTNFVLVHGTPQKHTCLGELDTLVCIGNDTLYCVDTSMSKEYIDRKLQRERDLEDSFLTFRQRMDDLFRAGRGGFQEVTRMHIHCGSCGTSPAKCGPRKDEYAEYRISLPVRDIIWKTADTVLRELKEREILLENGDGTYRLRSHERVRQS